jgi:DNA transposition AAA+ family ATPase
MHSLSHPELAAEERANEQSSQSSPSASSAPGVPNVPSVTAEEAAKSLVDKRFKISGEVVNKATADLEDRKRNAIRWLYGHAADNDLTNAEVGRLIGASDSTISLVFRGKYPASLDNIVEAIEEFKELLAQRSQHRKIPFISTSMTEKIWNLCNACREFQRIGFIFGDQQIGKTAALEAYEEAHNHGSTIMATCPTGGALSYFLPKLCAPLHIEPHQRNNDLRRRILESFDDRMLLIIDEAHQCVPPCGSVSSVNTIEFVREIFNEAKCGVVICATNVFRESMEKQGTTLEKILRQTNRRRLCSLQLPNKPKQADLNAFAEAYGLPKSQGKDRELENKVVEQEALGMWLTLLRMASKIATQRGDSLQWQHVHFAYAGLKELEGK